MVVSLITCYFCGSVFDVVADHRACVASHGLRELQRAARLLKLKRRYPHDDFSCAVELGDVLQGEAVGSGESIMSQIARVRRSER